jgi:membrane protein YqaA with SNARE-associated domain
MLSLFAPLRKPRGHPTLLTTLRHLGAAGLFFLAILDSSPIPTFGGPDILTALLAASHRPLWWEYAVAATAGSVVGAYLTFRVARSAGSAYLDKKFKHGKLAKFLKLFQHWGTGTLIASTAIPLPSPTSLFFAAAGAGDYPLGRFLAIVTVCRGARYFTIAFVAGHYGRQLLRVLRHPLQHWGWIAVATVLAMVLLAGGILASRRLEAASIDNTKTGVQSPAI